MSEAKRRAVVLIAEGATERAVSEALGVNECTISRWRQDADFQASINRLLTDARDSAKNRLRQEAHTALDTL